MIEQSWAEPERFEAIFRRYFGRMHQYLAARVGSRIADDLAAEVFTAAFAQRQRYDLARAGKASATAMRPAISDHVILTYGHEAAGG